MSLADYLKAGADSLLAATKNLWRGFRLADERKPGALMNGFRLARTGKHRNTRLTRHEQTRNPAGSKFWNKCPVKLPEYNT